MKTVTIDEIPSQLGEMMQEIKQGYHVWVYNKENMPIAAVVPIDDAPRDYKRHPGPRQLGTLGGTFREVGDGRMSMEEFLGESL